MPDLYARTVNGNETQLTQNEIDSLAGRMNGRLLTSEHPEYEQARRVWNAMIDRRPALIARCVDTRDISHAVDFARENDLVLAVRGGGHNITGNAVCDGGIVIDLSMMKNVRVDPSARTVRVEGGATLGDLDRETQAFGLATPVGINSTTGVAGLTLGGGFGWLSRKHGLSVDNLLSADVILADGRQVRASESDDADLFWAIRGGGGNYGVVSSFEFLLHPVGPDVLSGVIMHPLAVARDALRFYRDFVRSSPEELACWFVLRKAPPLPFVPLEWHGREVLVFAICYSGKIREGERVIGPLRSHGRPIAEMVGPTPFVTWQATLDPLLAPGLRNYWKSHYFRELSDGLIDVLLDFAMRLPDPASEIAFAELGGRINSVPVDATPYPIRDADFALNTHARWEDPRKDHEGIGWARDLFRAAAQFASGGAYVNFLTDDEGDRVKAAYGPNYARLVRLKNKYDPGNLFRLNQNIRPTPIA
jgi:FAD/FMN-containing dehydrogenase